MNKIIISPSILSADFANLSRDVRAVEDGGCDWIHVDVMDGHFVNNISIGVPVVKSLKNITELPLDVHLMITNPEKYIDAFASAGADIITFHYEACPDKVLEVIQQIHDKGLKAGISIKPQTDIMKILPFIKEVELVLVMTVEPGFGGQSFMHDCAQKIPTLRAEGNEDLIIQVDGGINNITAKICTSMGANSLVAGNYIYKSGDIASAIQSLR